MIDAEQFRTLVVRPVLNTLQAWSEEAEELLMFTAALESDCGTYLAQIKGPALGVYQCEPGTHTDIWRNFLLNNSRLSLLMSMHFSCPIIPMEERLVYDLKYATAIARIHYLRVKESLPSGIEAMWEYYKKHYNTGSGKAKKQSIAKYAKWVGVDWEG